MINLLIVAAGGALGAAGRYAVGLLPVKTDFPLLTLLVNAAGAVIIGFLAGLFARGGLTDTEALIEGIESMQIGALGMDTAEGEEGIIHCDRRSDIIANRNWFYLHQFRNVIMTQHMAFYTEQAVDSMVQCGIEGIVKMVEEGTYPTMLD